MPDYRKGTHTVYDIQYHFVWVTKYRYQVLRGVSDAGRRIDVADVVFDVPKIFWKDSLSVIIRRDDVRVEHPPTEVMVTSVGVEVWVVRGVVNRPLIRGIKQASNGRIGVG